MLTKKQFKLMKTFFKGGHLHKRYASILDNSKNAPITRQLVKDSYIKKIYAIDIDGSEQPAYKMTTSGEEAYDRYIERYGMTLHLRDTLKFIFCSIVVPIIVAAITAYITTNITVMIECH